MNWFPFKTFKFVTNNQKKNPPAENRYNFQDSSSGFLQDYQPDETNENPGHLLRSFNSYEEQKTK